MDFLTLAERILALLSGCIAFWKMFKDFRDTVKPSSEVSSPPITERPLPVKSADLGLYAIALLVSAVAGLSLCSALFARNGSASGSVESWLVILVAAIYAAACVLPVGVRRDLRHLMWISLAGLAPAVALPIITLWGNDSTIPATDAGSLPISLYVWIFLTAAFVIYAMSKGAYNLGRRQRWVWSSAAVILICTIALGSHQVAAVKQDPRAHSQIEDKKAWDVQSGLEKLDFSQRILFYQLASEAALSPDYADAEDEFEAEAAKPDRDKQPGRLDAIEWLQRLQQRFESLPEKDRSELLQKRLDGVYGHPPKDPGRIAINLPGISTKDRFESLNERLIIDVFRQYPSVATPYLWSLTTWTYSDAIKNAFKKAANTESDLAESVIEKVQSQLKEQGFGQRAEKELYSENEAQIFGLPSNLSRALIRRYYRKLALDGFRLLSAPTPRKDISEPVTYFNTLDKYQKKAFLKFVSEKQISILAWLSKNRTDDPLNPVVMLEKRANPETANLLNKYRTTHTVEGSDETKKFITDLTAMLETPDRISALADLLSKINPQSSVSLLFDKKPLELANKLEQEFSSDERAQALAIIKDPVAEGVKELQRLLIPVQDKASVSLLMNFLDLSSEDQEAILHNLSMDIYELSGPYTLGLMDQPVDRAAQYGLALAMIVASVFSIPELLIIGLLGGLFGRQLLSTSFSADKLIRQPANVLTAQAQPTVLWDFVGRTSLMDKLKRLSLRNSGTVGLVGRRGIGKTRMLRELLQEYNADGALTVWLDCPTSMSQDDFVQSIGERMLDVVESRFAAAAGIPNQARRRLDRNVVSRLAIAVLVLTLIYGSTVWSLSASGSLATDLILPSLLVTGIGICVLFVRISGSAAFSREIGGTFMGETSWFEWQYAYDAITWMADRLQARRTASGKPVSRWNDSSLLVILVAGAMPVIFIVLIIFLIEMWEIFVPILAGGMFYIGWRLLKGQEHMVEASSSTVSFTFLFRQFVMELTERIRAGALGPQAAGADVNLVVVVDELDKIVDRDELKTFIRVIKTVFDMPRTRFFLSISQDAYRDLVLGSSLGKNEFDSSFDHIEQIGPMELDSARELIRSYVSKLGQAVPDDATIDIIAALGKGVPRDILRRCDVAILLAAGQPASISNQLLIAERENLVSGIQYLTNLNDRVARVFTERQADLETIYELITGHEVDAQVARVLSENYVYVHLLATENPVNRRRLVESYYHFLYSLPTLSLDSIRSGLSIMARPSEESMGSDSNTVALNSISHFKSET